MVERFWVSIRRLIHWLPCYETDQYGHINRVESGYTHLCQESDEPRQGHPARASTGDGYTSDGREDDLQQRPAGFTMTWHTVQAPGGLRVPRLGTVHRYVTHPILFRGPKQSRHFAFCVCVRPQTGIGLVHQPDRGGTLERCDNECAVRD